jgi:nucleoredoxin
LAEFYNDLVGENPNALEIVFVSSDSDDSSFAEYYKEMPWVSVVYTEESVRTALGQKYSVRGIPSFIGTYLFHFNSNN